jgi:hypothetical protein
MTTVPDNFRIKQHFRYPEDNEIEFERWFFENWTEDDRREREYLPIFWTAYFCRHKWGRDYSAKRRLQEFVRGLDRHKEYYSIVQYDLGPIVSLPRNVKIFAMSGPVIHYPLPLISQPHKYEFQNERSIFANFVGALTHPIRKQMVPRLSGLDGFYVSTAKHTLPDFCEILSKSVFTLCPRGFGETSFRIQEALQYGSIPVYISDKFIIQGNSDFNEYGVQVHSRDISALDRILKGISPEEIRKKQENGRKIYDQMFTYQGCKKLIIDNL